MMSSTVRLGAFILVALIMFGVMVFLIGDKQLLFSRTYQISAPFNNVPASMKARQCARAAFASHGEENPAAAPTEDKISVELQLDVSTRDVIKKDSVASIETEGCSAQNILLFPSALWKPKACATATRLIVDRRSTTGCGEKSQRDA